MKALIDYRMKEIYLSVFEHLGIECIKVITKNEVYDEVSGHPDIFFTNINGTIVKAENVTTSKIINCIIGEKVEKGYPNTAKYNVCINKKYAICNYKYIEENVKKFIEKQNLKVINVNQGYARCSTFSIDESHYITSDIGIKNELEKRNLNVLYMPDEDIKLIDKEGNYSKMRGFIGGALFKYDKNIILFGDADKLNKCEEFLDFITDSGYILNDFKDEDIIDYGSVILV